MPAPARRSRARSSRRQWRPPRAIEPEAQARESLIPLSPQGRGSGSDQLVPILIAALRAGSPKALQRSSLLSARRDDPPGDRFQHAVRRLAADLRLRTKDQAMAERRREK